MVLFGTSLYGCGSLCVLSGDDSGLPEPGRPDTPRTHIASTKAWSWLKGLRQAVVDRDKGGELASLAGDTLQEAIEAARRGIRRVRRTPHLPVASFAENWSWAGNPHGICPSCAVHQAFRPSRARAMDPLDHRSPTWTCQLQGLLLRATLP